MFICVCFGLNEAQITETIQKNNITTPKELADIVQVGTQCGLCIPTVRLLLRKAKSERKSNT